MQRILTLFAAIKHDAHGNAGVEGLETIKVIREDDFLKTKWRDGLRRICVENIPLRGAKHGTLKDSVVERMLG